MNWGIYKIWLGVVALFISYLVEGQDSTKVNFEGDFWQNSSWEDNTAPASILAEDSTIIFGKISSNTDIVVGNGNKLVIVDTLIVSGNLEFKKGAILDIRQGAVCIVFGDLKLNNSVNLEIGAHLIVGGSLEATANNGSIDITTDSTAAVYILGDVDTTRIGGIGCGDPSNYVPPEDENGCNFGDIISLEDNENDEDGIYDLFVENDSVKGITPVYNEICNGDSVIISALFVEDGYNYIWCDSLGNPKDDAVDSFEYVAKGLGEYFVKIVPTGGGDTIYSHRAKVVEIVDTEAPIVPTLLDTLIGCNLEVSTPVTSNNCAGTIAGTTNDPTSFSDIGTHIITWSFDDGNGNIVSADQNVNVIDTVAPTLTCFPDTFFVADPALCGSNVTLPLINYSDNCSIDTIYNSFNSNGADASGLYPLGITDVEFTVIDVVGNTSVCQFSVLVSPDADNYISAKFSTSTSTISAGGSLGFTNTALNSSATFLWSFPGAIPATSTVQKPAGITYNSPGTYTATLVVSNDCESVSKSANVFVVADSTRTFNEDGSFTIPDCVTEITVQAWGAGGGGNSPGGQGGGGGGGGAYASSTLSVTPGTIYSVDVGLGGTINGPGENTIFGEDSIVVAVGGGSANGSAGSIGGQDTSSVGNVVFSGGNGGFYETKFGGYGGGGGGSAYRDSAGGDGLNEYKTIPTGGSGTGDGGNGGSTTINAENGNIPGGGGGGKRAGGSTAGTGANGQLIVIWTVDSPPEIVVDSIPRIPQGSATANIYYTEISGNPTSYSIEFSTSALDSGFVNVPYTALGVSPISVDIPFLSVPSTYGGILKVQTIDSCESDEIPILISILDTAAPVITCPETIRTSTDSLCFATDVDLLELTATDNAYSGGLVSSNSPALPGQEIIIVNDAPEVFPIDTTIVTWTVKDGSGNTATCEQIVVVEDNELPTIACPTPAAFYNTSPGECFFKVPNTGLDPDPLSISDNCSIDSLSNNFNNSNTLLNAQFSVGSTPVIWTVVDSSGNEKTCQQTIVVVSEIDVVVTPLADYCQSGETLDENDLPLATPVEWTVSISPFGGYTWSFDYTINDDGVETSGSITNISSANTTVTHNSPNSTAQDKTITITISNINKDDCPPTETNLTNNTDTLVLLGVPNTSDIKTDN